VNSSHPPPESVAHRRQPGLNPCARVLPLVDVSGSDAAHAASARGSGW
jgi:hypothetical protein